MRVNFSAKTKIFALALLLTLLNGCFSSSSSTSSTIKQAGTSTYGAVVSAYIAKSAVNGATCSLYNSANTLIGGPIASANGVVVFSELSSQISGMVYVQCVQGSYTDEATGSTKNAPTLRGAIDVTRPSNLPATSGVYNRGVVISPLTELAMRKSQGNLSDYTTQTNNIALAFGLQGVDISTIQPTNLNLVRAGTDAAGKYGTLLAALTEVARTSALGSSEMSGVITALESGITSSFMRSDASSKVRQALAALASVPNSAVVANYNSTVATTIQSSMQQQQTTDPFVSSITATPTQPFLYSSQVQFIIAGGNLTGVSVAINPGNCASSTVAADGNSLTAICTTPASGSSIALRAQTAAGVQVPGGTATFTLRSDSGSTCASGNASITGISPTSAEYGSTQLFSVYGCNLPTSNMQVTLGTVACTKADVATATEAQFNCKIPNVRSETTGQLTIANFGGSENKTQNIAYVTPALIISSASPNSAQLAVSAPGNWSIIGSGLHSGLTVRYNGALCSSNGTVNAFGTALSGINCSNVTSPSSGQSALLTISDSLNSTSTYISLQNLPTPVQVWDDGTPNGGIVSKSGAAGNTYTSVLASTSSAAITYTSSNSNVAVVDSSTGQVTYRRSGRTTITASQVAVANQFLASSITYTLDLTVTDSTSAANQPVVSFAYNGVLNKTYGELGFTNAARVSCGTQTYSNSDITYISTDTNSHPVSANGEVMIKSVGSGRSLISAVVAAKGNCSSGFASYILEVAKAKPTLNFTPTSEYRFIGASDFSKTPWIEWAGVSSNIALTYTSSKPTVASVSNTGLVSVAGTGSTTITATFPGDGNYLAASATYTLSIQGSTNQNLQFANVGTINKIFGTDKTYTNTAGGNCNGVAYAATAITYYSSDPINFPVSTSGLVTIKSAGSAVITANAEATGTCSATSNNYVLNVDKYAPVITQVGATIVGPTAAAFKPFTVTWLTTEPEGTASYTSTNPAVASIDSAGLVTVKSIGITTLSISTIEDGRYKQRTASYALSVAKLTPVIDFTSDTISKSLSDLPFSNALTYSCAGTVYTTSDVSYSSSDGTKVSIDSNGLATVRAATLANQPVTITANLAAKGDCNSATAIYTVTVSKTTVAIEYASGITASSSKVLASTFSPFTITWPSASTAGTVSYTSSQPSIASVNSSGVVTAVAVGTAVITATISSDSNYNSSTKTHSVTVTSASSGGTTPTMTFAASSLTKAYGDAAFTNNLSYSCSGATYTAADLSYSSSDTAKATVTTAGQVTILAASTTPVTITAAIVAKGTCAAATATYSITINKATPNLAYASGITATASRTISQGAYSPFAITWAGTPGTVSYSSSTTSVATVATSTGIVTPVAAGSTTITATVAADANYNSANLTHSLTLTSGGSGGTTPPTLSFAATTVNKTYGDAAFTNSLTANCAGVGYAVADISFASSSTTNATVASSGQVTLLNPTTSAITITANVVAKGSCSAGTVSYSLNIAKATPTLAFASGFTASGSRTVAQGTFSPFSITWPGTTGTITYTSSATSIATVSTAGVVTPLAAGTATITATVTADSKYNAPAALSHALTITSSGGGTGGPYTISGTVSGLTSAETSDYGLTLWIALANGSTATSKNGCAINVSMTSADRTAVLNSDTYAFINGGLTDVNITGCQAGSYTYTYSGAAGVASGANWSLEIFYQTYDGTKDCIFSTASPPAGVTINNTTSKCAFNNAYICAKATGTNASANITNLNIVCTPNGN